MHITADISILNDVYTYFTPIFLSALFCSSVHSAMPLGYLLSEHFHKLLPASQPVCLGSPRSGRAKKNL